jgi:hypothetical protein
VNRAQFLATPPRDLVRFIDGQAPIVEPKPARMSQRAYDRHIDSAGIVIITWRVDPDDGRRFDMKTHDAESARVLWVDNDRYNERWPEREHRIYLSARWADANQGAPS